MRIADIRPLTVRRCIAAAGLLALLAVFLYPVVGSYAPIGYDAGLYRYLFLRYAEALVQFQLPDLPPWAQEHPMGLFVLASPLLWAGIPVDWLLTWIWAAAAVGVVAILTHAVRNKWGSGIALWVPVVALASLAFQDGYAAMYWKTFVSLGFSVLAMDGFERKKTWWLLPAL